MKYRKLIRWAIGCLAVAALLIAGLMYFKPAQEWPQFPKEAKGPAPAVIYEVERDFGWRTGDVVPVNIYIREFPGTSVDVDGLALEGDFEVKGDTKVDTRATADGGKVIRVHMTVQSFSFKPAVSARVSMTWNQTGSKEWNEFPKTELVLHTSPTYDGRDGNLQEGHLTLLQGTHLLWTVGLLVLGIAGFIAARKWRNWSDANKPPLPAEPKRPLTLYEWAMARFDKAWDRIQKGDRSDDVFREIDHVVRKLAHVETVQISHLEIALSDNPFKRQALFIIKTCERKIFRGDALEEKYIAAIKVAFDEMVSRRVPDSVSKS
jgi:hypothetical protein